MSDLKTFIDGKEVDASGIAEKLEVLEEKEGRLVLRFGDKVLNAHVSRSESDPKSIEVFFKGRSYVVQVKDRTDMLLEEMGMDAVVDLGAADLKAPMPGLVVNTLVESGSQVAKGDALLVLEAMKMENLIKAEGDAVIDNILVKSGETVEKGQLMITFKK